MTLSLGQSRQTTKSGVFSRPSQPAGPFCHWRAHLWPALKSSSLIANTAERVEEQQRAERDDDARAIIELMEDELNSIRDEIDALRAARPATRTEGGDQSPMTDTKKRN